MDNAELKSKGPERFICFKLGRVMRKVQRYYENKLAPFGITPVQFYVFSVLWENDGLKFKDLAESVNIDGSTLTGILDRMERGGYVKREDDPEDRRSLLLFLTERARENGPGLAELAETLDREVQAQFTREDYGTFTRVLDQLFESEQ